MRPLLLSLNILLAVALLGLALPGCEPGTKFGAEAPFTIDDIDTRVADVGGQRRVDLVLEVSGARNGSEGSYFLVDLDVVIKAHAPGGQPLQLPDNGRVNYRLTQPNRMHQVTVPVWFSVPADAPTGSYQVTVDVVDKLGEQTRSSTVAIDI